MPPDQAPEPLTIQQFAGVTAALGDGISLEQVLEQEAIDPASFPAQAAAVRERIAASVTDHLDFLRALAVAEDCLGRKLFPLDEEPTAWVALLTALAGAEHSGQVLDRLSLRASDMNRLGRIWKRKSEADPRITKLLREASGRAEAPSTIRAEPVVLRPFPWTPPSAAVGASQDEEPGSVALEGTLSPMPVPQRVLATYQLSERLADELGEETAVWAEIPADATLVLDNAADPSAETLPLAEGAGSESAYGTLPFEETGFLALLHLDRYAELVVALRTERVDSATILERFGVRDQGTPLHDIWRLRFEANPALRARLEALVQSKMKELVCEGAKS